MLLNQLPFLIRKAASFIEHIIRNCDFTAVMHEAQVAEHFYFFIAESHPLSDFLRIERHSRGMSLGIFILCIDEICKGLHRLFDNLLVMCLLTFEFPCPGIHKSPGCQPDCPDYKSADGNPEFLVFPEIWLIISPELEISKIEALVGIHDKTEGLVIILRNRNQVGFRKEG